MNSEDWYSSLYSDLWENNLYEEVVGEIERSIAIAKTPEQFKRLIAILFAIQRLQTILSRKRGLKQLEEGICSLAAALASEEFYLGDSQKSTILAVLAKNGIPEPVIQKISSLL